MNSVWRDDYRSWGGTLAGQHVVARAASRESVVETLGNRKGLTALAFGCGASYGDVALNPGGLLVDCRPLNRFISFDVESGILTCEAGVQLAEILSVICRPQPDGSGWFLPVTPGTRFVTVGGAIANDVHGKNHHRFGTFGCHLLAFELVRTDGSRMICSPRENCDMFAATIGGLGLTGIVLTASIQLRRVPGFALVSEDMQFGSLDEFFTLTDDADDKWEYTAAWIDCLARGAYVGRGIFTRANHAAGTKASSPHIEPRFNVPIAPPISLISGPSVRMFNAWYWRRSSRKRRTRRISSYEGFLYPLDAIGKWNRLYGPRGFYQFQCAIPSRAARSTIHAILETIAASGQGSMLAVLKKFGEMDSPGMLSFPVPGTTFSLDFPNAGEATQALFARLEAMVREAGGRLYPAKDSLMSPETFELGFPQLDAFRRFIDPGLGSAFARRVGIITETGG